ncbi:MAG: roadblock/LC7 domain-containing protein [Bryobacterales bacterium]|nr:roadblock/LC7 domain-containing protein [Bryobacterales bacterium]
MSERTSSRAGFRELLDHLVEHGGALTALLVTRQGSVVSEAGRTGYLNTTAMAALVAGMFSATKEVARMVGESQFSILLQQGEKRHIHISLVSGDIMMVVIFEDYSRIGQVRHEARKAGEKLTALLAQPKEVRPEPEEATVTQFREYALNLIDRIFQT